MAQGFTKEGLAARYEELVKTRAQLVAKSEPLRKARTALQAQLAPLEAQAREITEKIDGIERPALGDIDNELAMIARALGARSVQAG